MNKDKQDIKTSIEYAEEALRMLRILVGAGFVGNIVYALQAPNSNQFASIVSVGVIVAGAALLIGGLLGFLFGIPRTPQQNQTTKQPIEGEKKQSPEGETQQVGYQVNTNLEQISDWLTKILVGVGLTQLSSLPDALKSFAEYITPGLGNFDSSLSFGLAMPLFFVICGFLHSYLWTRLFLPSAFKQADIGLLFKQVKDIRTQKEKDLKARNLTERQLSMGSDVVPQEDLNKEIKEASLEGKDNIFYLAQNVRNLNWEEEKNKPQMERTIPIFRALIEADIEGKNHRNHGQLGYALKDKLKPESKDYKEAIEELSEAINIRNEQGEEGDYLWYEFNRAYSYIKADRKFKEGKPSDQRIRENILKDVKIAFEYDFLAKKITKDPTFQKWFSLNKVDVEKLDIG
jgi:tetratricopeptide (TPR) repeat protein